MANSSTTFDTLTDVGKEQRLLFLYDSNGAEMQIRPFAYSTTANLSFSADTVDVSNKMDGNWTTVMQGKKSAEVSVDALVTHKDDLVDETDIEDALKNGASKFFVYAYYWIQESADGLSTDIYLDTAKPTYAGRMVISSLELTSDNGDVCKYSCSGASQGAVKRAWYFEGFLEDISIESGSVTVAEGEESMLVYNRDNEEFILALNGKYYRKWTGYACVDWSEIYDDDANVRTDVLFYYGEDFYYYQNGGLNMIVN